MDSDKLLEFAKRLALEAGKLVETYYYKADLEVSTKSSPKDIVTEADKASEKFIMETIQKVYPEHGVIGEEGTSFNTDAQYVWVIDPIDGTTNFSHRLPIFAVSVGLLKDGEPYVGAIYNPISGEFFFAQKNCGAYMQNVLHGRETEVRKIQASSTKYLAKSILSTGFNTKESIEKNVPIFAKALTSAQAVRRLGAATIDICYTACGYFDGFWEFNLKPWDVAAGIVILQEAGGTITTLQNTEFDLFNDNNLVITNTHIHAELIKALSK